MTDSMITEGNEILSDFSSETYPEQKRQAVILREAFNDSDINTNTIKENPFSTTYGQQVVSIKENFWDRLSREGSGWKKNEKQGTSLTPGASFTTYANYLTPSTGKKIYPKDLIVSFATDQPNQYCIFLVNSVSGVADANPKPFDITVLANTSFTYMFDADFYLTTGGYINLLARIPNSLFHNTAITGNTINASKLISTLSYAFSEMKGMTITGTGIPANTKVVGIVSSTSIVISNAATATGAGATLTFTDSAANLYCSINGSEITI